MFSLRKEDIGYILFYVIMVMCLMGISIGKEIGCVWMVVFFAQLLIYLMLSLMIIAPVIVVYEEIQKRRKRDFSL